MTTAESYSKIRADPIPNIVAAGKVIATGGYHADMSIRQDQYGNENRGNLGTPPHIRKYRKTNNMEPGQIIVHPGLQEGRPDFTLAYAFGAKKDMQQMPAGQIVKAQNLVGLADKFNDAKEAKYASSVREPLGKSYQRGYNWPGQVGEDATKHSFGVPTKGLIDAKEVLYPMAGSMEEKGQHAAMYKKTHGNFQPGEQRTRDYNWNANPNIKEGNTVAHPFGYGEQRLLNGAARSIQPERIDEGFPKTVIVKKIVED